MAITGLFRESSRFEHIDLDGDGGVTVARMRDYVKVNAWGGAAGPMGCTANLSPADARAMAHELIALAADAERYADQTGVDR